MTCVEARASESRKRGVVGQKDQSPILIGIANADPPQIPGVVLPGVEAVQGHKLIALQTRGPVHGLEVEPPEPEAALGPGHKEGRPLMDAVEVKIGTIEDVDGPCRDGDLVEDVDFINAAGGDDSNRRDVAPQIQQRMELQGSLASAERGPGEQRQAQVDRRGIHGIDALVQFDSEGVADVTLPRSANKDVGGVCVDAPVSHLVGVRQGVAGDFATDAHVVELLVGRAQAGLDVQQALPAGQLGEGYAQVLVPAGEAHDPVVSVVALDAGMITVCWQEVHKLREDHPPCAHPPSPSARMR